MHDQPLNSNKIVSILLVEDEELDAISFERSLRKHKIVNPLTVARDGIEALKILRGIDGGGTVDKPFIVLMDINMPRMNGIECIREIRNDKKLHDTVVFILTTSSDEQDLYEAYNLNVAGYMVKSELGEQFTRSVHLLDKYFSAIVLPTR